MLTRVAYPFSVRGEVRILAKRRGPIIATDIGGTYARLGIAYAREQGVRVEHFRQYVCAEYPSLVALISDFISSLAGQKARGLAVACAGYPQGDTVLQSNLPWRVSLSELREQLGIRELMLVNDFAAIAYGTQCLEPGDFTLISNVSASSAPGPALVMGPGTGLGAAVVLSGERRPAVLSTEAGHAAFAPTSDLELEVLKVLRARLKHVSNENIVSGPGLVNIHAALSAIRGEHPTYQTPAEITGAALERKEPRALDALNLFCGALGSIAGQLTLIFGAQGGVYLAGGVLPRMKSFLLGSSFLERFHGGSSLRSLLEQVPVKLVEHEQLGVIGAASRFFDTHER